MAVDKPSGFRDNRKMTKRCLPIDELINAHVFLCREHEKRRRARQQRTESQAAAPIPTSSCDPRKLAGDCAPLK